MAITRQWLYRYITEIHNTYNRTGWEEKKYLFHLNNCRSVTKSLSSSPSLHIYEQIGILSYIFTVCLGKKNILRIVQKAKKAHK